MKSSETIGFRIQNEDKRRTARVTFTIERHEAGYLVSFAVGAPVSERRSYLSSSPVAAIIAAAEALRHTLSLLVEVGNAPLPNRARAHTPKVIADEVISFRVAGKRKVHTARIRIWSPERLNPTRWQCRFEIGDWLINGQGNGSGPVHALMQGANILDFHLRRLVDLSLPSARKTGR